MVLYAVGAGKRIFALVKVESEVRRVDQEKYPFRLDISYLINLHPSLGVPISDITTAKRDLVRPIQWGLSYFWLHPEEFTLAESKLKEVDKMLRASKK